MVIFAAALILGFTVNLLVARYVTNQHVAAITTSLVNAACIWAAFLAAPWLGYVVLGLTTVNYAFAIGTRIWLAQRSHSG